MCAPCLGLRPWSVLFIHQLSKSTCAKETQFYSLFAKKFMSRCSILSNTFSVLSWLYIISADSHLSWFISLYVWWFWLWIPMWLIPICSNPESLIWGSFLSDVLVLCRYSSLIQKSQIQPSCSRPMVMGVPWFSCLFLLPILVSTYAFVYIWFYVYWGRMIRDFYYFL